MKFKETDLYTPLKYYLEKQGYTVNSEVHNCDIVARKNDELVIIELKKHFSVSLLAQALKRKQITDSVYVALPLSTGKSHLPNFSQVKVILKRLEVGLIIVNFLKTKTKIQVIFHPREYVRRRMPKRKMAIIKEIEGRYAEFNVGGSPVKEERISAYKQETIKIAYMLKQKGSLRPKELRRLGTGAKTQNILSNNVYGWFQRVKRGIYTLNDTGELALRKYKEEIKKMKTKWHRE